MNAFGKYGRWSLLLLAFAASMLGATSANAAACTSAATGNWDAATTWAAPCNVAGGPVAADTVTIAAAHTVTVTANAAVTGIIVAAPSVAAHGVNINPGITLSVSGAVTMAAPTVNGRTSTFAVGTGTLNAGSIAISGGTTATRISQVTVGATGVVNVTGSVTSGGTAAQSRFVATGASNITVGGNFAPGAFTPGASTVTVSGNFTPAAMVAGTGTVVFTGGAGQTMGAFTTYNNVTINKTVGTAVSLLGTTTIGGVLNVNSGTYTVGAFALTVTGATNVGGTLNITSATGAKTFTGLVTINPGGIWTNTTAAVGLRGGLTHNGATFTAGTGLYAFSTTAAQSLNCAAALTIPSLTVTAPTVLTNNCNLTVSTALAGTGNLTNSSSSTLNLGGTSAITTLTATAVGNTVNYTGAAQTVKATPYSNLGLAGSGAKTLTGVTAIGGNFTMSGTATATAAAALTVSGNFSVGATNTFGNGANALNVAGDFQQNGTFTAGSGVVTLNGGAAVQTISGTGALGFANLTVSNTGGITLARNVTVTSAIVGAVTLTSTCPTDYTLTSNGGATVKHSCPGPSVLSINYASGNPTAAATVSWTVTFNASVTGLSASNFALVNTGLAGAPAITAVTGSGTTWTVSASTGTGSGTLGLNMTNTTGVSPTINYLPFTGQVYSVRQLTAYYHDTTAGVNIGFDGTTNVVSGTNVVIPPIITASLTTANTCTGNARSISHPAGLYTHSRWYLNTNYAAQTKISANPTGIAFLRGAAATNTVVVSLYDYDPVLGGKTLIGSSPAITLTGAGTTTAYPYTISSSAYIVPAGHRLMLEYNFNQPLATDAARVYCSSTSAYLSVTESVVSLDHIQVSHGGSGVNCQAEPITFIAHNDLHGTYTLPVGTVVNIATSTGHGDWMLASGTGTLVNNGNGSATYTSGAESSFVLNFKNTFAETVNFNVTSGSVSERSGTASTDAPYDQNLTFTSSGFRFVDAADTESIVHQAAGVESATYYLQAIGTDTRTGACVGLFADNADVSNIELAFECNNPATCAGEAVTITNNGIAGAIAANANAAVSAYTSRIMRFGANSKAAFSFNYPDVGQIQLHARYNIPRDTVPSSLSGNYMSSTTVLPDTTLISGSNKFVVRPDHFDLSNVKGTTGTVANPAAADGTGAKFIKAGEAFTVTVKAMSAAGLPTPNYGNEIPAQGVRLTSVLASPAGGNNPSLTVAGTTTAYGAIPGSEFGAGGQIADADGVATVTDIGWNEVGIITLGAEADNAGINDYLGAGGVSGATTGTTGNIGRFYPAYFDTDIVATATTPMPCPTGLTCPVSSDGFVYSGQPFSVEVTAMGRAGNVVTNYDGSAAFSKAVTLAAWDAEGSTTTENPASGVLANNVIVAADFAAGIATIATPTYTFATKATAPIDIYIRATDTDSVTSLRTVPGDSVEGGVKVASGRIKLSNGHGSELLPLPLMATVQYFNGNFWVSSLTDTVTALAASDFALAFPVGTAAKPNNLAACETALTVVGISPVFALNLSSPGVGNNGWANLTLNLDGTEVGNRCTVVGGPGAAVTSANRPWLQFQTGTNPAARATFGVYKGNNEFIYMRENY